MNILIRAKRERVEHKFEDKVPPDTVYCYWTGIYPKNVKLGDKVMFTDGETVYAEGEIIGVHDVDGLMFKPLRRVSYPQPKKPPTRGFTYVSEDDMR